ncbi:MAG: YihY/virulence factor BrkB family protein [Actinobacteria bacterium]|nr:YihY/virulence factor BrkB family protein [Actinomycetota bacterium]
MTVKERLRAYGDQHPTVGQALDIQERFGEVNGSFVSSGIAISVFIAVFPLLLVAIAVVGFVASGDENLGAKVVDNLGLTGSAADLVTNAIAKAEDSKRAASIVGLLGLAWSGSGVGVALQRGVRTPWQEQANGVGERLAATAWLVVAGLGFALAIAMSSALNWLPDWLPGAVVVPITVLVGVVVEVALFWWMFWGLGTRRVPARDLLPGAIVAGIGFEILKLAGTLFVPRLVANSSALYGPIGVVFAIIAWLTLFARLIVYSSVVNAVRYERREGTVVVPVHVPKLPGDEAEAATRSGLILVADDPRPAVPG